jgi:hypothetical protein
MPLPLEAAGGDDEAETARIRRVTDRGGRPRNSGEARTSLAEAWFRTVHRHGLRSVTHLELKKVAGPSEDLEGPLGTQDQWS